MINLRHDRVFANARSDEPSDLCRNVASTSKFKWYKSVRDTGRGQTRFNTLSEQTSAQYPNLVKMFKNVIAVFAFIAYAAASGVVAPLAYTAPAVVTAASSQVVARNYNGIAAAPLVAAAPVAPVAFAAPIARYAAAAPVATAFAAPLTAARVATPFAAPLAAAPFAAAPFAARLATPFAAPAHLTAAAPLAAAPFAAPFAAPYAAAPYAAAPYAAASYAAAPYAAAPYAAAPYAADPFVRYAGFAPAAFAAAAPVAAPLKYTAGLSQVLL